MDRELKIYDHDLDHFFHYRDLIAITTGKDRDPFNFSYLDHDHLIIY